MKNADLLALITGQPVPGSTRPAPAPRVATAKDFDAGVRMPAPRASSPEQQLEARIKAALLEGRYAPRRGQWRPLP